MRDSVGVIELCGFSRFTLSGDGAADWLRGQITGALPRIGRLNLIYFATQTGRILTEISCIRHGEDSFTLMSAAVAQWHDFELLSQHLRQGLTLSDDTGTMSTLLVSGPNSRELFAQISDADLSLGWLSHQTAVLAGETVTLARVSFVGELGWEVHCAAQEAAEVYDAIRSTGAAPIGMYALNSMRIEKGYLTWKGDLSTDYSLWETGLGRLVKLDKRQEFPGKAALQAQTPCNPDRRYGRAGHALYGGRFQ